MGQERWARQKESRKRKRGEPAGVSSCGVNKCGAGEYRVARAVYKRSAALGCGGSAAPGPAGLAASAPGAPLLPAYSKFF